MGYEDTGYVKTDFEDLVLASRGNLSLTTTGTSEEVLATVQIPAGALIGNYSGIHAQVYAVGAANANSKTVSIRLGGAAGAGMIARATTTSADTFGGFVNGLVLDGTSKMAIHGCQSQGAGTTSGNIYTATVTSGQPFSGAVDIVFTLTTPIQAGDATIKAYRLVLLKKV